MSFIQENVLQKIQQKEKDPEFKTQKNMIRGHRSKMCMFDDSMYNMDHESGSL